MLNKIFNPQASIADRTDKHKKREELFTAFQQIELGQAMLEWAAENSVEIKFKKLSGMSGYSSASGKEIVLDRQSSLVSSIATLAHELRHAWQLLKPDHPIPPHIDLLNPFARPILNRFMEADAFSFEALFMMKYMTSLPSEEKAIAMLALEPSIRINLTTLIQRAGDETTERNMRRLSFDGFFLGKVKNHYDKRSTVQTSGIDRWFGEKYAACFAKARQEDRVLKEETLINLGQSAWGECAGQNFLKADDRSFDISDDLYMGHFQSAAFHHLCKLSTRDSYQGLNVLEMKDGKKRRLIRLEN